MTWEQDSSGTCFKCWRWVFCYFFIKSQSSEGEEIKAKINTKTWNIIKVLLNWLQCSSECLALFSKARCHFLLYRVVAGKTGRKQIQNLLSTMWDFSWFLLRFCAGTMAKEAPSELVGYRYPCIQILLCVTVPSWGTPEWWEQLWARRDCDPEALRWVTGSAKWEPH